MATYSFGQLEGLWINAGGSPAMAPIMAAIALAESSGDPQATNKTDNHGRQTSWGLWQISDGTHNQPVNNILDPEVNAEQAVKKEKSQGLGAWGTYTSGAYKRFLKTGVTPITTGLPSGSTSTANGEDAGLLGGVTGDIGSAIGSGLASAFSSIFKPFIEVMVWGAETIIGGALIIAGVFIIVSNTQTAKNVQAKAEKTAMMVAAPEAAPELEAVEGKAASSTAPKTAPATGFTKSGPEVSGWVKPDKPKPRVAHSQKEFRQMRQSGYTGPIRHEYDNGKKGE